MVAQAPGRHLPARRRAMPAGRRRALVALAVLVVLACCDVVVPCADADVDELAALLGALDLYRYRIRRSRARLCLTRALQIEDAVGANAAARSTGNATWRQ